MKEEELRKAADEYTSSDKIRYIQDATDRDVEDAFVEGAKWALKHQWISVDNSLPEYDEVVLVTNDCENCWFGHRSNSTVVLRDNHDFATDYSGNNLTYWMPIPKFDKSFEK